MLDAHVGSDDPLAGYADRLRDPAFGGQLRGYLTGSLDSVLRLRDDGVARFAVVDYKTNWLGAEGEDLTAWHYRPSALATAMQRAHYPLQALFYVVALHRYLRWRLPGYRPDEHLAGRAVPVPAGDDRRVGATGRRPAVRRVRLAAVAGAGHGAERPARPGCGVTDVGLALRASGTLAEFNAAGVLAPADVHVAVRLAHLVDESDEAVLLGAAMAVRAPRLAHVCTDLATVRATATSDLDEPVDLQALPWPDVDDWIERLAASPLVAVGDDGPADRPLRLIGTRLYLDRYWRQERRLAGELLDRSATAPAGVEC